MRILYTDCYGPPHRQSIKNWSKHSCIARRTPPLGSAWQSPSHNSPPMWSSLQTVSTGSSSGTTLRNSLPMSEAFYWSSRSFGDMYIFLKQTSPWLMFSIKFYIANFIENSLSLSPYLFLPTSLSLSLSISPAFQSFLVLWCITCKNYWWASQILDITSVQQVEAGRRGSSRGAGERHWQDSQNLIMSRIFI